MFKTKIYKILLSIVVLSIAGTSISQYFWIKNSYKKEIELSEVTINNCVTEALNIFYSNTLDSLNYKSSDSSLSKINQLKNESFNDLANIIDSSFSRCGIKEEFDLEIKNGKNLVYIHQHIPDIKASNQFFYVFDKFGEKYELTIGFQHFPRNQASINHLWFWYLLSIVSIILILFVYLTYFFMFKKLNAQFQMRTNAINNLMHEFKTPLASLKLASEMLQNKQMNSNAEKVAQYGVMIGNEIKRLQRQGEYLQNLVLIEEGQVQLDEEPFSAGEELKRIISQYLLVRPELSSQISMMGEDNLSMILFDRTHFEGIVLNLVENAVKYGGSNVKIVIEMSHENEWMKLSVSDNGPGIPKKFQQLIFQRFFRVPTGNQHNIKGFGIGLYYVKMIVEMASGTINVSTSKFGGAKFEIKLPLLNN